MIPIDLASASRQELTRAACNALAAEGKKPSLGLVREWTIMHAGSKKGSDGDVQKDLNEWFTDLLKRRQDISVDGLPDAVAALARDFWNQATSVAESNLDAARKDALAKVADAEARAALAERHAAEHQARAEAIGLELRTAIEVIRQRDDAIAQLRTAAGAATAEIASLRGRLAGIELALAPRSSTESPLPRKFAAKTRATAGALRRRKV